jgi:hypothetical protein
VLAPDDEHALSTNRRRRSLGRSLAMSGEERWAPPGRKVAAAGEISMTVDSGHDRARVGRRRSRSILVLCERVARGAAGACSRAGAIARSDADRPGRRDRVVAKALASSALPAVTKADVVRVGASGRLPNGVCGHAHGRPEMAAFVFGRAAHAAQLAQSSTVAIEKSVGGRRPADRRIRGSCHARKGCARA